MSTTTIFIVLMFAMFPAVIIAAVVVKLWEARKVKRWPATEGRVIASEVVSHKKKPGDHGYNFGDTEVTNEPRVEYEYQVGSRKYRCQRITIGEKTSGDELEAILERYPVGAAMTVYYDPADPNKAMLERDLPSGVMLGVGCLLLFFIGGPLLAAFIYFNGVDALMPHLANPKRAPFIAAATGFGLLLLLFAFAFTRYVGLARHWPVTRGRITASGVEAFRTRRRRRKRYRSSVVYTYEVNGRKYTGDRLALGVVVSASFSTFAERTADRYPVGTEVDVYYNPQDPGEAVLNPHARWHYLLWVLGAAVLAMAGIVARSGW